MGRSKEYTVYSARLVDSYEEYAHVRKEGWLIARGSSTWGHRKAYFFDNLESMITFLRSPFKRDISANLGFGCEERSFMVKKKRTGKRSSGKRHSKGLRKLRYLLEPPKEKDMIKRAIGYI